MGQRLKESIGVFRYVELFGKVVGLRVWGFRALQDLGGIEFGVFGVWELRVSTSASGLRNSCGFGVLC